MTDGRRKLTATLLAAAALLAAAGCGSDDSEDTQLPPRIQSSLTPHLDSIAERVADGSPGACDDIYLSEEEGGDLDPIDATLDRVPDRVDPDVRAALEQSVDRLKQLVDQRCDEIRGMTEEDDEADVETETVPVETETEVETVPPETTPAPPETTPTTPPETPTTPTDEQGNGGTGGGGGGGGGGNTGQGQGQGPTGEGPPGQGGGLEAP